MRVLTLMLDVCRGDMDEQKHEGGEFGEDSEDEDDSQDSKYVSTAGNDGNAPSEQLSCPTCAADQPEKLKKSSNFFCLYIYNFHHAFYSRQAFNCHAEYFLMNVVLRFSFKSDPSHL